MSRDIRMKGHEGLYVASSRGLGCAWQASSKLQLTFDVPSTPEPPIR